MSFANIVGGINWARSLLMLVLGSLMIFGAGAIYGFMTNGYFFTRLLSPLGYIVVVFFISRLCTTHDGDTHLVDLFSGLWFGVLALYIGWVFWIYFLKYQMFFSPGDLWSAIGDIAEAGYRVKERRTSHMVSGGTELYMYWVINAVLIVVAGIAAALAPRDS